MKIVPALAAGAEAATGIMLIAFPSLVLRLLFGAEAGSVGASGVSEVASRVAGMALIGLGVACWPSGASAPQPLWGILTYGALAALYLAFLGIRGEMVGPLLWPAVAVHAMLVILLLRTRAGEKTSSGEGSDA
jgi:hypothetical protein